MIKVSCKSCGHSLGAPSRYAGKKVKCPKCEQPIRIPQGAAPGEKADIIKFRCSHCGQKIGLARKYAGKSVTCAKCKKPTRVPAASAKTPAGEAIEFSCDSCGKGYKVSSQHAGRKVKCKSCGQAMEVPSGLPEPVAAPADGFGDEFGASDDAMGAGDFAGGQDWAGDLLAMEAAAPEVEDEMRLAPPPRPSAAVADEASDFGPAMGAAAWSSSSGGGGGGLDWMFGIPTGILASFAAAMLGAVIWAAIACTTGFEIGYVAIGVGAMTGGAMMFFAKQQSTALGLLAAVFALAGIFMGKVLIAKWYVLPEVKKGFHQVDFSSEEMQDMVKDDEAMFGVACMELADQGQFSQEFAFQVIMYHADNTMREGRTAEHDQAIQQAEELLAGWSVTDRQEAAQRQYTKLVNNIGDVLADSGLGLGLAFMGTLSLFDLLWVFLAIGAAYKAGAGGD